jgi:vacuolar-type H+-ATPase subunit I/STV1
MSLKSFHIIFVSVTFLMSLFFVLWSRLLAKDVSTITTAIGWCGIVGLVIAPLYGVYFWRKSSKLIL